MIGKDNGHIDLFKKELRKIIVYFDPILNAMAFIKLWQNK